MNRKKQMLAAASAAALTMTFAACGGDSGKKSDGGDSTSGGSTWTLGTTDSVTAGDPAGSYDFGSWNMQYNVFQQLMTIPANGAEPEPDAAESCEYTTPKQVVCKLKSGLKFSNGNELTSSDVLYSFKRNIEINDPNGSAVLLGMLSDGDEKAPKLLPDAIKAADDTSIEFNLKQADTTFLKLLTTATTSIVDEETFPADKLLPDNEIIGSGPFKLSQYKPGEQAVFEKNSNYTGDKEAKADKVFVQYFNDPAPLKTAVDSGQIDVAWRTLSPTDLNSLEEAGNVNVVRGKGSEFRYWVFQLKNKSVKDVAVRQAVAQLIDRDAIAKNAYDDTVKPAYSIVPPGFGGQKDSFQEKYGAPDVAKAKKILADAGITTPVDLKLGYTPTHYGPNAVDEANELSDQLTSSGLFKVSTDDAEWEEYQTLYKEGAYDLFILGWYPDILDADNYLTPFVRDGGFYANNYSNPEVNKMLDQELAETDVAKRDAIIGQLQDKVAEDVPLVPSWNGQNVAVASKKMSGVEETLDPTYIFRFWMISKG